MIRILFLGSLLFGLLGCSQQESESDPWRVERLDINSTQIVGSEFKSSQQVHLAYPIHIESNDNSENIHLNSLTQCQLGSQNLGTYSKSFAEIPPDLLVIHLLNPYWWKKILNVSSDKKLLCQFQFTAMNDIGSKHHFKAENIEVLINEPVGSIRLSQRTSRESLFVPEEIQRDVVGSQLHLQCDDIGTTISDWSHKITFKSILNALLRRGSPTYKALMERPWRTCVAYETKDQIIVSMLPPFTLKTQTPLVEISTQQIPLSHELNGEPGRGRTRQHPFAFAKVTIKNNNDFRIPVQVNKSPANSFTFVESNLRQFATFHRTIWEKWDLHRTQLLNETGSYRIFVIEAGGKIDLTFTAENKMECAQPFAEITHPVDRYVVANTNQFIYQHISANRLTPYKRISMLTTDQSFCYGPKFRTGFQPDPYSYPSHCNNIDLALEHQLKSRRCYPRE
tara:strand:- start:100282 stop:101637 length:1356 start_codon:yes stop_codon:yes gene_type:complete